jgi:hypothetical protein
VHLKAFPLLNLQSVPPDEPRLRVQADGTLQIGRGDGQIEFGFRLLGLKFDVNTRPTASGSVLQLTTEVGPVPFSAEGVGIRRATLAIIEASQMMPEARLVISRHRWIYCVGKALLPENWQPNDAIIAATRLVLAVKPYLAMLTEMLPKHPKQMH